MIALLDGDLIAYRSAASCSPTKAKQFTEPLDVAIARADRLFQRLLYEVGTDDFECYLGGVDNYRYTVYPAYKGSRVEDKPLWLNDVREYMCSTYGARIVNGMETDDMLGIQQTRYDGESVIVSLDKDLRQVPGQYYSWEITGTKLDGNMWIREAEHLYVTPLDGLRTLYKQIITGDGTDNIPAFDGAMRSKVPKFVQKLLDPIDEMYDEAEMYQYALSVYGMGYGDMPLEECHSELHRNAQLIYILRRENEHWQPPGLKEDSLPSLLECSEAEQDDFHQSMKHLQMLRSGKDSIQEQNVTVSTTSVTYVVGSSPLKK